MWFVYKELQCFNEFILHTAQTNRQGILTWRFQSKPPTASGPLPYLYPSVSSIIRSISGVGTVVGALAILSSRGSNQPGIQKCPMRNTATLRRSVSLTDDFRGRHRSRLQYKYSVKYRCKNLKSTFEKSLFIPKFLAPSPSQSPKVMPVSHYHTFRYQSNPPTGGTPSLMANTYSKESSMIESIEGHTADWRLRAMRSSRGSSQPKTTIIGFIFMAKELYTEDPQLHNTVLGNVKQSFARPWTLMLVIRTILCSWEICFLS